MRLSEPVCIIKFFLTAFLLNSEKDFSLWFRSRNNLKYGDILRFVKIIRFNGYLFKREGQRKSKSNVDE